MKFYRHKQNGMIYFLHPQDGKVMFMPPGMRWEEAFDAHMRPEYFPIMIIEGVVEEVK